jgi:LAO/AO transport system kinase
LAATPLDSEARAKAILAGDIRQGARLMRDLDDTRPGAVEVMKHLYPHTGRGFVLGVTGNPGAGKSTVVDALIALYRGQGKKVGVVAVDPTSPFSGGAILGDRIRMQRHATDEGVFIRSLATRGHLGGLSRSTSDIVSVLDAMGYDVVIIETVGVGQDEVDVVSQAECAVVVTVPGMGDEIQAIKAGILEIADVLVVNKADREGADRAVASIEALLSLHSYAPGEWRPPIVKTTATTGDGLADLVGAIGRFRTHTEPTRGERRRARAEWRLRELIAQRFLRHVESSVLSPGELSAMVDRIAARALDPYTAADEVLTRALGSEPRRLS